MPAVMTKQEKKPKKKEKKQKKKKPVYTAKTADRHVLYQLSVQSPESEVEFCTRVYKKKYDRKPTSFREDFCGTALLAAEWVKTRKENTAVGVDLDKPTLDWGIENNVGPLDDDQKNRIELIHDNVLNVTSPKVDIVGAFNFSYFLFMDRNDLVNYFKAVKKSLKPDGLFILDAYGGWEAQENMEEETEYDGFSYIWDQADYNPIDDTAICRIHFTFPDGTKMKNAFQYRWRLWTLASVRDCLVDAGFKNLDVYWEGTDKDGDGNGIYKKTKKAENCPGWNAYLVAHQ